MSKKKFFTIPSNISVSNIMELFDDIYNNRHEKNADIVLTQNLKFGALGNKMAFCQLINTWFKKNPNSKIRVYDQSYPVLEKDVSIEINKIIDTADVHFLLCIIHGSKNGIYGYTNKDKEYTLLFKKAIQIRLIADYKKLGNEGSSLDFPKEYFQIHPDLFFGVDFFKNNSTFYSGYTLGNKQRYILKKQDGIDNVSKKLFKRIEPMDSKLNFEKLSEIQTYFYEAFDNTYEWGRFDWLENENADVEDTFEESVRLFFISNKLYSGLQNATDNSGLAINSGLKYFGKRNQEKTEWGLNTKVLELSILDNGLGIVQTYKREKKLNLKNAFIPIEEEYNFLIEAFGYGKTGDTTSKSNVRGIGLYNIITKIKDVFLIVRTGHLYLFRDFNQFPYKSDENFYLFDAMASRIDSKNYIVDIKKHTWSQGTLFTFLIPF